MPAWLTDWWNHHLIETIFWAAVALFVIALIVVAVNMSTRDWEDTAADKQRATKTTDVTVRDEPSVHYEARRTE